MPELPSPSHDPIDLVLAEYLLAKERGEAPTPEQLVERHPQLADELLEFFENERDVRDQFDRLEESLSATPASGGPVTTSDSATLGLEPRSPSPTGRRADGDEETLPDGSGSASVGEYELLALLGEGGMGRVFKAWHGPLERAVALKMILGGHSASASDRRRFRIEAQAVARLHHPGIVQIYEVGEHEGQPYLALEFCEGGTLEDSLETCERTPRESAVLVRDLALAVQAAHDRRIVHRDLKPGNVLLTEEGVPKVSDFGLAKKLDESDGVTRTNAILGTPAYMAPEQAAGRAREVGPATDVYALGAILYRLLTGRPPFQRADPMSTLLHVLEEEPVAPRQLSASVPTDLETICRKCLEKEPAKRYESAQLLAEDLDHFLEGEPILARPIGRLERVGRWCRRNPWIAGMSVAVACLLILLTVGSIAAAVLFDEKRRQAEHNATRARQAERAKTKELWKALLSEANASFWSRRPGHRFASLEALKKAAALRPDVRSRNAALACFGLVDLRIAKEWRGCPTKVNYGVDFDSAFEHYARSDSSGNISVRRLSDDREVRLLPGAGGPAWIILFGPGSDTLAAKYHEKERNHTNRVVLWNWRTGVRVVEFPPIVNEGIDFSPDGTRLALASRDGQLRLHDARTGEETHRYPLEVSPMQMRFSPSGDRLALSTTSGSIVVRDVATGRTTATLRAPYTVRGLAWHPSGQVVAGACANGSVYLWDSANGQRRQILKGHSGAVTQVAFTSLGDLLASLGWDGKLRLWEPLRGEPVLTLEGVAAGGRGLRFHANDRYLGYNFVGSNIQLWEVAAGRECSKIQLGPRELYQGSHISPDSRLLAVATNDGVRLYDLALGHQLAWLRTGFTRSAFFHPSGRELLTWGKQGLRRFPLRRTDSTLTVGLARQLLNGTALPEWADLSGDGRRLAYGDLGKHELAVYDLVAEAEVFRTQLPFPSRISLSPDGRWLAGGTFGGGEGVRVWDVESGKKVCEWVSPEFRGATVRFSPDNRRLLIGLSNEYRLVETATWQVRTIRKTPSNTARRGGFFATGEIATNHSDGVAEFFDPAKNEVLARWRAGNVLAVSPDGSRLVTAFTSETLGIWDLHRMRRQLREMDLDWVGTRSSRREGEEVSGLLVRVERRHEPEVNRASATVVGDADLDRHLDPRLVDLEVVEASVVEILDKLTKRHGISLRYEPTEDSRLLKQVQSLSFRWRGTPLWSALDELGRSAGLVFRFSHQPKALVFSHGPPPEPNTIGCSGPVRLQLEQVSYYRGLNLRLSRPIDKGTLTLTFRLNHHLKGKLEFGQLRIVEASTASGKFSLESKEAPVGRLIGLNPLFSRTAVVRLPLPRLDAEKLNRLKVVLPMILVSKDGSERRRHELEFEFTDIPLP